MVKHGWVEGNPTRHDVVGDDEDIALGGLCPGHGGVDQAHCVLWQGLKGWKKVEGGEGRIVSQLPGTNEQLILNQHSYFSHTPSCPFKGITTKLMVNRNTPFLSSLLKE